MSDQSLQGTVYEAITSFQFTAQLSSLQHAQLRQHLAEHLAEALSQVQRTEREFDQVLQQRDAYHDAADALAYAIAPIEVIGEHSSDNCPWTNALDHVTPAAEVAELREQLEQARSIAVRLENENARLTAELEKYVGKEPTRDEELEYLSRCFHAVHDVLDEARRGADRWENPLAVPEWVAVVEKAAAGERPDNPDDKRRRIYLDGKGNAWIDHSVTSDGTRWISKAGRIDDIGVTTDTVRADTGSLREIGRTW
ncbi:hypothetical protein [Streptomyces lydicus]|uniref:hypothetical protein n=1 Tax=Streptomyces lydicus TaxID=47763 RepID=UPI003715E4D9